MNRPLEEDADRGVRASSETSTWSEQVGRFAIVRKLGAGGMGVVFEAIDAERGARVALKTLRSVRPRAAQRFKNEFRALSDLSHPNVVELHELHVEDDRLYFTMELVEGTDFLSWVSAPGVPTGWSDDDLEGRAAPDYDRLTEALRQLVAGVAAIHGHGKLHRDLKPSNVLVDANGRVVVLDFGLVGDADEGEPGITASGVVVGTPAYLAPEQLDAHAPTRASDWYAVGVILYQALTGALPHAAQDPVRLLVAKATRAAPDPRDRVPSTPDWLAELTVALLDRDAAERPDADAIRARLPAGSPRPEPPPSRVERPFIGRADALATLRDGHDRASRRRAVVTLVEGPSGIGKSALIDESLRALRSRGATVVLRGRCYERESVPYKALDAVVDHLTRWLRRLPPAEVAALLPRDVHALTRLFPALLDVEVIDRAPRRPLRDDQEQHERAFDAFQELLGRITDRRPLVVHIDDLQWTDDDSVTLLLALLSAPNAPHLHLVAAYRAEDASAASSPGLSRLIAGIERAAADVQHIVLGPLPPDDTAALTSALLEQHELPGELAERLAEESEGSPLFAGELVRHLARAVAESERPASATPLPKLAEVLGQRIASLPEPSRRLLETIAVAARPTRLSVVRAAADARSADPDPLVRLRTEHFVRTVGPSGALLVESLHDRIREAAVAGMSKEARREAHRALGDALLETDDPDPELLLGHLRAAGDPRSGELTLRAAERAAAQLAFDRAAELYAEAVALGAGDRATLETARGEALANAGRGREAADAFLRAAADAEEESRLELTNRAAMHLLRAGYAAEGGAHLDTVLRGRGLSRPRTKAGALAGLLGRRAWLRLRGLSWTEKEADPAALAQLDVCWSASRGLIVEDLIEASYFQAQHLTLALATGDAPRVLVALGAEAKNLSFFGDAGIERSRALLAEVRALANRLDTPAARGVALDAEGHVALMSARWSDALRINREAEATFRDHCPGAHHDVFDAMALQAAALYALGDIRGLARVCGRSARGAARRNDLYHETMARLFLAAPVALARDDVDGARREIEAQREVARHHERMQIAAVMLLHVRIAHALYARRVEADREELDLAHRALRTNPLLRASFTRADVFSYRGRLVLGSAEESPARRAAALDEARRLAHDLIGQPFASAAPQGRMLLAGAAFLAGDRAAAAASLRHAIDAFDALEMALWAAAARLRLGELLGGDDGTAMRAGAGEAMAELGVVDADAFARVLAPGFEA